MKLTLRHFTVEKLVDDRYRYRLQMIYIPAILGAIALVMTLLNLVTHKSVLMLSTAVFTVVCALVAVMAYFTRSRDLRAVFIVFGTAVLCLFTYFLLYGGTEGFSPIWICVLPSCGMLLMGRRHGTVLCAVMLAIIVFLFWIPLGRSLLQYHYTDSYLMRFPIVYCSFYAVGYFFETVRLETRRALDRSQERYRRLSVRDTLTGVHNRQWFNDELTERFAEPDRRGMLLFIADVDRFKRFNDTYGHLFGDQVLAGTAQVLARQLRCGDMLCRWGGEEFSAMLPCARENAEALLERLRRSVESARLTAPDGTECGLTISIGGVWFVNDGSKSAQQAVSGADAALYTAKENGRNRTVMNVL